MVKVWKDVDEVIKMIHDLEDERLRQLDKEMTKKPNFENYDKRLVKRINIKGEEGK